MTFFIALLAGIAGAALGWIAAAVITFALSGYYGVTDFEGQRALMSFFVGGLGGAIGLIAGVWITLRFRSGARVTGKAVALRLSAVLAGIAAIVAVVIGGLYWFSPILNPNAPAPKLVFEIMLPRDAAVRGYTATLSTERNTAPATLNAGSVLDQSGRPVISGTVDLYYRSSWRILELKMEDAPEQIFALRTSARPGHDAEFGSWQRVSSVGNGTSHPRLATADDAYDIRYRVVWPQSGGYQ